MKALPNIAIPESTNRARTCQRTKLQIKAEEIRPRTSPPLPHLQRDWPPLRHHPTQRAGESTHSRHRSMWLGKCDDRGLASKCTKHAFDRHSKGEAHLVGEPNRASKEMNHQHTRHICKWHQWISVIKAGIFTNQTYNSLNGMDRARWNTHDPTYYQSTTKTIHGPKIASQKTQAHNLTIIMTINHKDCTSQKILLNNHQDIHIMATIPLNTFLYPLAPQWSTSYSQPKTTLTTIISIHI